MTLQTDKIEDACFSAAMKKVRREHAAFDRVDITDHTILGNGVSFDGSWLTRGRKSRLCGGYFDQTCERLSRNE